MNTSIKLEVVIVGAGIAGLTCAIALARCQGIRVRILEKSPVHVAAGNGIQVPCNACHVLRSLGLLEKVIAKAQGTAPGSLTLDYGDSRLLLNRDFSRYEEIYGAPWLLIHRADYIDILLEEANRLDVGISLGCEVREIDFDAPWIRTADGQTMTADVIIGCDGINSSIRTALYPDISPNLTETFAYRALFTPAQLSSPLFQSITATSHCRIWVGPNAHVVFYPLQGGACYNLVLIVADAEFNRQCSKENMLQAVQEHMSGWNPLIRELLSIAPELVRFPLWKLDRLPSFISGHVALIGDSAHPTPPYLGQGAAMAVEDALVLGSLLGNIVHHSSSFANCTNLKSYVPKILKVYDALQRPRCTEIVSQSQTQGRFNHLPRGPEQHARDTVFAEFQTESTVSQCPWVDSRFNRKLLGRNVETVCEAVFEKLSSDGLFNQSRAETTGFAFKTRL